MVSLIGVCESFEVRVSSVSPAGTTPDGSICTPDGAVVTPDRPVTAPDRAEKLQELLEQSRPV